MSSAFRRFELLLPLRSNDGRPVPGELIADTLLELEQRFGAVSSETQTIQGFWQHQQSYVPDTPATSLHPPLAYRISLATAKSQLVGRGWSPPGATEPASTTRPSGSMPPP